MTKKNFLFLVLTVTAGLVFSLGMCMCLLPEWQAFIPGVALTALGALALLAIGLLRWIMAGRPMPKIDWQKTGRIACCTAAALVLGTGMAMIMAFDGLLLPGLIVGVLGIVLGLGIIPLFRGLK